MNIVEFPAIKIVFHRVVNTTGTPTGVEGREWWVATKWQEFQFQFLYYQRISIEVALSSTHTQSH